MHNQTVFVFSQVKAIIDHICNKEALKKLSTSGEIEINADLATAISEIVKIYMRQIARNSEGCINSSIIDQASQKTINIFSRRLKEQEDINHNKVLEKVHLYVKKTKKALADKPSKTKKSTVSYLIEATNDFRFNENEISSRDIYSQNKKYIDILTRLKEYLLSCKIQANINDRNIPDLDILKVGFDDFIEGLLVYPFIEDSDKFLIDFINLPSQFSLRDSNNSNFPFEFIAKDFIFILDEDGSIFVFVENLPSKIIDEVGCLLIDLALGLYGYRQQC